MINCKAGYEACQNYPDRCPVCFDGHYYVEPKTKKRYQLKKHNTSNDKRQGASFEQYNHRQNQQILKSTAISVLTPNSGAGYIKGDEHISGIISIMEELKTKVKKQAPGKETFTIHKEWLDKLHRESDDANKEFWYLKFSFFQDTQDIYCIVHSDIIMSMVKTMVEDRKTAQQATQKIDLAQKRKDTVEAENLFLKAKIDELQAEIAAIKNSKG